jgi:hypothetical protein
MKKQIPVVAAFALAIGSSVSAQEAFQWRSEDGGNGHWYRIVVRPYGPYNWNAARADAQATGGDLASFEAPAEWGFMRSRCRELPAGTVTQFLAGGQRQPGAKSPWLWLTGEPFSYFAWNAGVPNDGTGENFVLCVGSGTGGPDDFDGWDDWRINDLSSGYVVEWSADCNNDGIVDYGQILSGQLADADTNGVPDTCECPCDVFRDNAVNGIDLGVLLGQWGEVTQYTVTDFNGDGAVDGSDLGQLLAAWGPCPS